MTALPLASIRLRAGFRFALTHLSLRCLIIAFSVNACGNAARAQSPSYEREELKVGDQTWSYHRAGNGTPLVLLHGFGASKESWSFILPYLSRHYDVIAVDLPGFGGSSKSLENNYGIDSQVDRLAAFVDALGLEKIQIAGNSMGGSIAGAFAAKRPERVASLWLLCPAGIRGAEPSELDQHLRNGGDNIMVVRNVEQFDRLMGWLYVQPSLIPDEQKAAIVAGIARNASFAEKAHRDLVADWPDLAQSLRGFDKPVLITWGERDRLTHPSGATILKEVLPQARLNLLPNCGHVPMLEMPEQTASNFFAFTDGLDAADGP